MVKESPLVRQTDESCGFISIALSYVFMAPLYFSELISSLPLWNQTFVDCAAPATLTSIKSAGPVILRAVMIVFFLLALSQLSLFIITATITVGSSNYGVAVTLLF